MEGHRQVHHQCRPALRPDVAIRQRQPVEPATSASSTHPFELHEVPCRLCALLHTAGAGGGSSGQYRFVQQHHGGGTYQSRETVRFCRSGRTISTPVSIKIFRSGAASRPQKIAPTLDLGVDVYYKLATDLIDNGLFGQAYALSAFNYAQGVQRRHRVQRKFHSGNFQAYANLAVAQQKAIDPVSNQYLFGNSCRSPISAA